MKTRCLGLTLMASMLALGGCMTVGPDYKVPEGAAVNAPYANAAIEGAADAPVTQGAAPSKWWRLYDDPALDQLVSEALASNADLRVAAANLARSRAEVEFANRQGGFSGKSSAAFQRAQESAEQYLLMEKLPVVNEGALELSVSYEFDLFGKLKRGIEAAVADDEAVEAAADLARITVVADVVRAYVESCSAAEELAIAQKSLELQRERVRLTTRLRNAGRGNQSEVTRGQTQSETLAADIPRYVARRRVAQYRLAMLLARAPSALPPAALACKRLPKLRQPIPVGDGAALLKRRPDVRQAERQLAASTARIGVATAALYPSVSFGASVGSVGIAEDLLGATTNRWAFGPLINWSFPINGQRARVQQAEAASGGALAHFDGVVLNALRETQSSLATYASDTTRADTLRTAYRSAVQSADETHRLYSAGRESFIADLDATRTLTSVAAQVAAAEGQVAVDQVNLFLALGGGWERDENVAEAAGK
ncbi:MULTISPECIES: efflux transporter outer membrane subunit [unclassified Caballeronia]|uniref:efflux transporter outer membrane subunit n=1 Tax=unclassified Caballeronia TaxID=2646786 RepID=UPI0028560504|nr:MULTISPECIES: efflux transporter outer membrane subunit [unclassified Caballeronia]MDR5740392.1 efflux transporter outer membrane subunit [Caballeronia sp. LZ016]MDR5808429.1 efflux transporter outer membrane subunit [Caballeronia sp. LZ019]